MSEQLTPDQVREKLIERYPSKVKRKRAKHMLTNAEGSDQEIQANVRTVPGIISQRGCTYAGCKGVILGPTRDVLSITHGPIGCGYYSWLTRRNQTATQTDDEDNFMTYCLSTDMQEEQIVFGGEKKLTAAIREAYESFKPKAIAVHATCPVGLIGDDIHQVAKSMKEELGVNVFGFSCEGYRGVSQSAGHHIANNVIYEHVVSHEAPTQDVAKPEGPFKINLLGEYNIGGDAFVLEDLFERMGITLISTFCGNSTYDSLAQARHAELNLVMCHRSINYQAENLEKAYGIPWTKVNFIGADQTAKSLRKIAAFFNDEELTKRTEAVIAEEMKAVEVVRDDVLSRTTGKKVALFVGGSRAHHYQFLFKEIGMEVVAAGYEFAHRDDYEGRQVLPNIKIDADSRNIEELKVDKHEPEYTPLSEDEAAAVDQRLKDVDGQGLAEYTGMMPEMPTGTLSIDDVSHHETEILIETLKPDMICCGIKEKYSIQKHGIPSRQLHSYDYGGPYAGFEGAINFWKDIDMMLGSPIWKLIAAPWDADKAPLPQATLG